MALSDLNSGHKKLLVICFFSTFICFFNQTTVNPALPTIMSDFNITASTAQWLLSGYLMIMAIMIPINAFLIERYSVQTICIFALFVYTAGCVFTGLGINFYVTLIGRFLQGTGHGLLMPTCMAVMLFTFPSEKRGRAMGLFGLLVGVAPVLGPTYSGLVVDNLSWHFVYFGVAIFALICLIACIFIMPKINLTKVKDRKLDKLSLITSTLGFGFILLGCSEFGIVGIGVTSVCSFILGGIITAFFFIWQTKTKNPMLEISVFKSRNFSICIIILSISQLAFMGAVVLFPFLIQNVLGKSPTVSGLVMIPSSIVMGVTAMLTGRLLDKYGIRYLAMFGTLILTIAGLFLSNLLETSPIYLLIAFLCLRNLGAGCVLSNINTWGLNSLPKNLLPHGNAVSNTFRQIACSFGAALSTSIYTFVSNLMPGGLNDPSAEIVGINVSFFFQAVICFIGFIICVFLVKDKKAKL